jgi:hypothetical protein
MCHRNASVGLQYTWLTDLFGRSGKKLTLLYVQWSLDLFDPKGYLIEMELTIKVTGIKLQ